ncbi:MAG: methionine gamma-lyase family protein, partial [Clostridia bacterium]|nr:methionine gamma-lyase family protein [Clostridia bacterium]
MTDYSKLIEQAETALAPRFKEIEKTSERLTARVLTAFKRNRVSETSFASTNGYGLDDTGRDTLDKIYAEVFGC